MSTYSQLIEALCTPDHTVTDSDLHELEGILDRVWNKLKINIQFTSHFLDRVNDARNKRQITVCELAKLFIEAFKKFGDKLAHISQREWEGVLTDEQSNVNVPFVLKHNGKIVTMVAKTVLRKPGFYTPDPKLAVDSFHVWLQRFD